MGDRIFEDIADFLAGCRETERVSSFRAYWQDHAITADDVRLLRALGRVGRCPAEIARAVNRCPIETHALLDAFASIGLADAHDGLYAATDVTLLYCSRGHEGT